jgi:RluA family pseudouridine synthase
MKKELKFRVGAETALLEFLLTCLNNKSRNHVKGVLKRGQVTVDGNVCTSHSHTLNPGQCVAVLLENRRAKAKMPLPIIYEDDDIIVIDKPAGILSVSTEKGAEVTAFRIINDYMKNQRKHGRIFIVHRLDRDTSGVMLFAKSERTKLKLQENWASMAIEREYIAMVEGRVQEPEGRIASWLRQTKTLLVYSSQRRDDGKFAVTNYRVIKTADRYSLLKISLETGRKNQIRVHMKDIGFPVAGDVKYGASTNPLGRLGLHASALVVKHPTTDEEMRFESGVPESFMKLK